ncbi:MAG TPA: hypothetical protein VH763_07100 [Gemmatimonadales bacterium]|jgi:hypothetical protein
MKSRAQDVRGREARLRPDFDYLYPGVDPNTWLPVERLIQAVREMLYGDSGKPGGMVGERLLREDHFEFRGSSPRPPGSPPNRSRLGDSRARRKTRKKS